MNPIVIDNPLVLLKGEVDSIHTVIVKIDGDICQLSDQIIELAKQKASLILVVTALDNEMDRIRTAPQQLELDLGMD